MTALTFSVNCPFKLSWDAANALWCHLCTQTTHIFIIIINICTVACLCVWLCFLHFQCRSAVCNYALHLHEVSEAVADCLSSMNDLSFAFRHEGTIRRFRGEHRGPGVSKLISLDWPELIGSGFESSIRKINKTSSENEQPKPECSFSLRLEQWQDVGYWFMLCRWLWMCQMLEELWVAMFLDMLYHVWIFYITHLCSLTFTFSSLALHLES